VNRCTCKNTIFWVLETTFKCTNCLKEYSYIQSEYVEAVDVSGIKYIWSKRQWKEIQKKMLETKMKKKY